jgi:hypothetical protein
MLSWALDNFFHKIFIDRVFARKDQDWKMIAKISIK